MSWLALSLTAAFSLATADALTKKFFSSLRPIEMGFIRVGFALPWLIPLLLFIPRPTLNPTFWLSLSLSVPLEIGALLGYMKALKVSPLSLSLPFLAFTPLFVILTGWLILGEKITAAGGAGLLLIVTGSYCLNLSSARTSFWRPFQSMVKEPGVRLILLVSLLYSLTGTLGKLAITHSSPAFFAVSYYFFLTAALSIITLFLPGNNPSRLFINPWNAFLIGAVQALLILSHALAISMIQAAYMLSLKRLSILFGILYGAWWFKEEKIKERMIGALIMLLGVFVISWWG